MKTQEEIEQLAEKHYTQITLSQRTAFKLGYTQCQEDMADEIHELKKQIQKAVDIIAEEDEKTTRLA